LILHLIPDDKVTQTAIDIFEKYNPENNLFVVSLASPSDKEFRMTKKQDCVKCFNTDNTEINWSEIQLVIVHYLSLGWIDWLNRNMPSHVPVLWIVWGGDLYETYLTHRGFKLLDENNSFNKFLKKPGIDIMAMLREIYHRYKYESFIRNKLTYISTTPGELSLLQKYIRTKHLVENVPFSYYPIDLILGDELLHKQVCGHKILVGNSAAETNNHEMIFRLLSDIGVQDQQYVVPFSYGAKGEYKDMVRRTVEKLNFRNVEFLDHFMKLSAYNEVLLECGICLFGSYRQQAWGNILVSLFLGAKVYLSSNNPLLQLSRQIGFVIFELESIDKSFLEPLTDSERRRNHDLCLTQFTEGKIQEYTNYISHLNQHTYDRNK